MTETLTAVLSKNALVTAFAVVGIIIWLSYWLSDRISAAEFMVRLSPSLWGLYLPISVVCKPGVAKA